METRKTLQQLLSANHSTLRDDVSLRSRSVLVLDSVLVLVLVLVLDSVLVLVLDSVLILVLVLDSVLILVLVLVSAGPSSTSLLPPCTCRRTSVSSGSSGPPLDLDQRPGPPLDLDHVK